MKGTLGGGLFPIATGLDSELQVWGNWYYAFIHSFILSVFITPCAGHNAECAGLVTSHLDGVPAFSRGG